MAIDQKQKFCKTCQKQTLHARHRTSEGWGCLLSVVTLGLYLPIWIITSLIDTFRGYRCQVCGRKLGFLD